MAWRVVFYQKVRRDPGKEWDIKLPGGGLNAPLAQAEVLNTPPLASPWLQCLIKKKMGVFLLAQKGKSSGLSLRVRILPSPRLKPVTGFW